MEILGTLRLGQSGRGSVYVTASLRRSWPLSLQWSYTASIYMLSGSLRIGDETTKSHDRTGRTGNG
jgi:hypothetical protein